MHSDDALNAPQQDPRSRGRECLSALMDGDGALADEACRAWRDDASLRADWHAYHVIGEVLRSEDAACRAARDARFVSRLREQLAREPVVVAPGRASWRARRRWMAPAAVAAGFVVVAGAVVATRMESADASRGGSGLLASRDAAIGATRVDVPSVLQPGAATAVALGDGSTLVRSAELDRYLAAHRQYASTSPLAAPGGVVRSVASVSASGR